MNFSKDSIRRAYRGRTSVQSAIHNSNNLIPTILKVSNHLYNRLIQKHLNFCLEKLTTTMKVFQPGAI